MTEIKKQEEKNSIVRHLVDLVGTTAGIILVSIGAITFLNVFLKAYVFDVDTSRYYNSSRNFEEQCRHLNPDTEELNSALKKLGRNQIILNDQYIDGRINQVAPVENIKEKNKKVVKKEDQKLTEKEKTILKKEYNKCVVNRKDEFNRRNKNDKGGQMAWGLAFLIVGIPILWFYNNRRRRK